MFGNWVIFYYTYYVYLMSMVDRGSQIAGERNLKNQPGRLSDPVPSRQFLIEYKIH